MGWLVLFIVIAPFGWAAITGAPYLPVLRRLYEPLLDMAGVRPGQTLVDLGSGDGAFLRAAARRGVRCIGYEINPLLWAVSRVVTWRYRQLVVIHLGNYWRVRLPPSDVVYVFLVERHMASLDAKLVAEVAAPTVVISMTFAIPNRRADLQSSFAFRYRYGGGPQR